MYRIIILLLVLLLSVPFAAASPLTIGVLLIEDSVPFYVAEQEGFFRENGVEVELIPFLSALERDSALAAGAIDGALSDPVGAILFDKGNGLFKITALCLGKKPAEGVFAILSSPKSDIVEVEQLKNVQIAVSNATIIEYVTDRMLEEQGFKPSEVKKIEVKKMPIRMQMLLSDSVSAATLPEPLASIAVGNGARVVLTDRESKESLSQTVILFRANILDERKDAVAAFFKAYDHAVAAINRDPERFRGLFLEKGRIPPFLSDTYRIPVFPKVEPFSRSLYNPIINWLKKKKLVEHVPYEKMVSTDFIGEQVK
ncbi:MAG: hypothetical protein CR981_02085 [Proteobacteria bacterium]|nr:MAG: hypothetical protein CR981_02085 [Pseudomonadota bacterium]PIE64684.1 MAG: hypothetical protein CSA26_07305 [Desulfobacterales bacterium]